MFQNPRVVNQFSATPRGHLNRTGPIANGSDNFCGHSPGDLQTFQSEASSLQKRREMPSDYSRRIFLRDSTFLGAPLETRGKCCPIFPRKLLRAFDPGELGEMLSDFSQRVFLLHSNLELAFSMQNFGGNAL